MFILIYLYPSISIYISYIYKYIQGYVRVCVWVSPGVGIDKKKRKESAC